MDRYRSFAPFYDVLSGEYPVYRTGRLRGIEALGLRPGMQVLDIGCGTGLNFAPLRERIGNAGIIVGIDRSPQMLRHARARAIKHGWQNVILIQADAAKVPVADVVRQIKAYGGSACCDAAIATYALSLMPQWHTAWESMLAWCSRGAALAVVDMQTPAGAAAVFTPLARLACWLGGADIAAHPWRAVEEECGDVARSSAWGGHIQIRAGRK
ncbi:class I SAM-dependent methyltransferase [Arthrobacter pigmenti]